jgi:hypothetical protein
MELRYTSESDRLPLFFPIDSIYFSQYDKKNFIRIGVIFLVQNENGLIFIDLGFPHFVEFHHFFKLPYAKFKNQRVIFSASEFYVEPEYNNIWDLRSSLICICTI